MTKYIPPGFDATRVSDGLYKAIGFGEPTRAADKATFFFVSTTALADPDTPVDDLGTPFDPSIRRTRVVTSAQVPCVVEFFARGDRTETFGLVETSRIQITLLDPEYQQVKGFAYVVAGGDKYIYHSTQPPNALGSLDVWTLWAVSEDER